MVEYGVSVSYRSEEQDFRKGIAKYSVNMQKRYLVMYSHPIWIYEKHLAAYID